MRILEGTPSELLQFCQMKLDAYQMPINETPAQDATNTYSPKKVPNKATTTKLEAIFRDYMSVGMTAKAIQEDLVKTWNIQMTGHQVCGWMGRMKANEKTKVQLSPSYGPIIREDVANASLVPLVKPERNLSEMDEFILDRHSLGDMDIDISQQLARRGSPMSAEKVGKRIKALMAEGH